MSETPPKPTYPEHMEKARAGLFEHYCMHPGCRAWGSFGFEKRYACAHCNTIPDRVMVRWKMKNGFNSKVDDKTKRMP